MTNSYGVNPTLIDPENVQAQTDLRTDRGAARCCQFFSASLPPAWYFFTKGGKTFADDKLGLPGNWTSNITRLVSDVVITPNGPKGFENVVIEMGVPLLYEFENDFKLIGSSGVFNLNPVLEGITPSYLGQTFVSGGAVWIAGGTSSASWIALNQSDLLSVVTTGDFAGYLFTLQEPLPGPITLSVPAEIGGFASHFVEFLLYSSMSQESFLAPNQDATFEQQILFPEGVYQQDITVTFEAGRYWGLMVFFNMFGPMGYANLAYAGSTNTLIAEDPLLDP